MQFLGWDTLQSIASAVKGVSGTVSAALPWPLQQPVAVLGSDLAGIIGFQPALDGVERLAVRMSSLLLLHTLWQHKRSRACLQRAGNHAAPTCAADIGMQELMPQGHALYAAADAADRWANNMNTCPRVTARVSNICNSKKAHVNFHHACHI